MPCPVDASRTNHSPSSDRRASSTQGREASTRRRSASLEATVDKQVLRIRNSSAGNGQSQSNADFLHRMILRCWPPARERPEQRHAGEKDHEGELRCAVLARFPENPHEPSWRTLHRRPEPPPLRLAVAAPAAHPATSRWTSASVSSISPSGTPSRARSQRIASRTFACARRAAGRALSGRRPSSRAAAS